MQGKIREGFSISIYWRCQLIGWGLVSLFWLYTSFIRDGFQWYYSLINYFLDVGFCIGLTHVYRSLAKEGEWGQLDMKSLFWKVVPALLILSFLFMLIANFKWSAFVYFLEGQNRFLQNLWVWNPVLITGLRHMSIWLLGYHLYHFYQREVQTTKINAQLSLIAKQAQFDNLSAQLNPHFLFNSLNSIKSLILENPKIARRAVDLLSDLLRSSLYEKRNTTISLEEEIALVKDYIELEKLRFEERLSVKFEIDEKLHKTRVLPFSIQLLVENALKHGIDKQMEGGLLSISVQEIGGHIEINIHNPGQLNNENRTGLGLKNLSDRLQLQYKGEAYFNIEEKLDNTVLASLILPINHHV